MEGRITGQVGGLGFDLARRSLFDESPSLPARAGRRAGRDHAPRRTRADGLRQRQPARLPPARLPARRRRQRAPRQGPGRRRLPPLRAHDLRPRQLRARRASWCSARSSPCPAAGRATRRTTIRSRRSTTIASPTRRATATPSTGDDVFKVRAVRHGEDPRGQRPCAVRRARLRHVLRLGDPPSAGQPLRRPGVHRPSTRGRWIRRRLLVARRSRRTAPAVARSAPTRCRSASAAPRSISTAEQLGARLEDVAAFAKYLGGCAANIAVGTARLGLESAMLIRASATSTWAASCARRWPREGVDVRPVRTDPDAAHRPGAARHPRPRHASR